MNSCLPRMAGAVILAGLLAGCGNRATRDALRAAKVLEDQKQYQDADDVLVQALHAREAEVRGKIAPSTDDQAVNDATKKVQSDLEILKMEREQVPIYLHLDRPDLASAVYADILAGAPHDHVVIDTLRDKDPAIRQGAVRVLGLAGEVQAIPALAEATKDSNQDVRRAAVAALGTIKDPAAVPPLLAARTDSYWFVRSDAADALGRERDPRAVEPLLGMIGDSDKTVDSSAMNALVLLASLPNVPADPFVARLNDPNPKVVIVCAVCLTEQKDKRALPVLLKLAVSGEADTRLHAVKALGDLGDPAALPVLRQLLQDPDVNVKGWSIIGLDQLKDVASVPALKVIAANPGESANVRAAANTAVSHIAGSSEANGTTPSAPMPSSAP